MVGVLSLSHTATLVAVETLLQHPPEIYSWLIHRLHRLLQSDYYSTVSGVVLERLCTYYPHKVTDDILLSLAPPNLHQLHLVGCDRVTSNGILRILEKCERLTRLCLQDCRCAGNLLCDVNVSSVYSNGIPDGMQNLGSSLTVLDLSRCELVTDSTIKNILHNVASLKQVHLVACTGITDEVFLLDEKRQLMRNEKNHQSYSCHLTVVDISSCNQLTSTAVRHLTTLCGPSLRCINISATSADCTALLFLSGYSMLTSLQITKQTDQGTLGLARFDEEVASNVCNRQSKGWKFESSQPDGSEAGISAEAKLSAGDLEPYTKSQTISQSRSVCSNSSCASLCDSCGDDFCSRCEDGTVKLQDPNCSNSCICSSLEMGDVCVSQELSTTFQVKLMPVLDFSFADSGDVSERNCCSAAKIDHCHICEISTARNELSSENNCSSSGFASSSNYLYPSSSSSSSPVKDVGPKNVLSPQLSISCRSQPDPSVLSELCVPSAADMRTVADHSGSCLSPLVELNTETSNNSEMTVRNHFGHDKPSDLLSDSSDPSCDSELTAVPAAEEKIVDNGPGQFLNLNLHSSGLRMDTEPKVDGCAQYPMVYIPSLEAVDLSYIELGDRDMASMCLYHLLNRNPNMQQLSLSWKELDDEMLEKVIVQNAAQLKSISLVDCQGLTTYGVAVLCDMCENLSILNLQGVNFIQDRGVSGILANGHVTKLCLSETMITDYTLSKIATMCCDQLRDLDLSWCEEITDEGIMQVVVHCTNLQRCLLRRCPVTEEALHLVAKNCTNLRHLSISGINTLTDGHLVGIALKLKHLEHLDIGWNLEVTDVGVSALLRYSYSLQTLIATGVKQITSRPFWPLVSDVQAFRRCKALLIMERRLRDEQRGTNCVIISSDEDDDDALSIPLRSTCYAPNLNQLQLEWCDCVSDSDLAEIAVVCRGSLHITDYYGIKVQPAIVVDTKHR